MTNPLIRYAKHALGLLALIFTLSPLLSSDENAFISTAIAQESRVPHAIELNKDHPVLQNAIAVQNKHSQRLMNIQGVLGTGVGIGPDGQPVIKIYLERSGISNMPVDLDGIPVKLEVTGMIVAFTDPTGWQPRPVPIGVSTGHPDITAGTIGARVIDPSGNVYALSNNHVYADINEANLFDNILQPGTYDGGSESSDVIGQLSDYEPIDFSGGYNLMDAAIAISDVTSLSNSTPTDDGYGIPNAITVPVAVDIPVQKYGRTTGLTKGIVQELNVLVDVCYELSCRGPFLCTCTKEARFINQFSIEDEDGNSNTSFSAGGDSGSLIVTDDENKNPIGLLFAGNSSTGYTFASPIEPILTEFGVTIDETTGISNTPPAITISSPIDGANYSSGETIAFNGSASDTEDGDISTSLIWTSDRDGQIGTEGAFSSTLSDGTHTITASVSDSGGATGSDSIIITVSSVSGGESITLDATTDKIRGTMNVYLTWSGAASTHVDIYRDGTVVAPSEENDGEYHDIPGKGGGTFDYQVCKETSTELADCSNIKTLVF